MATDIDPNRHKKRPPHPFRQALLRGLGVVFPPLLTILIFLWVINTTHRYVLEPVTTLAREGMLWLWVRPEILQQKDLPPEARVSEEKEQKPVLMVGGRKFQRLEDHGYVTFIPKGVYDRVLENPGRESLPQRGLAYYRRFVEVKYLRPERTIPFFLALFIILLYLLGKFMAAGIGRFFVHRFERGIHRLPLVSNVYSAVKQVSDFLFSRPELESARVVAVEYPRKGIWTLAFVTSEGMLDIRAAANEPVLTLFVSTSPMPLTGFIITARKSETIDLNVSIDQAFQFIISCGVVIPPQQLQQMVSSPDALPAPADSAQPTASREEVPDHRLQ
jgi:uncharacterized membrane protein